MAFSIILVHFILAILLFFIINWIGRNSYSIGYMEISMFVKMEEAPALNFVIRVFSPLVYLLIVSALLYYFNLDKFIYNIYCISIYYIVFRLIFNLITGRGLLLNWSRQIIYWIAIVSTSYFGYIKIIKLKSNILPDFASFSNELWVIILIFIYQVINKINYSQDGKVKRKDIYLTKMYWKFKRSYGKIIESKTQNEILEAIAYSVLIYENFNRPRIIRWIENLSFYIKRKPHTLGIMQVYSNKSISDAESVSLGCEKIKAAHNIFIDKLEK